MITWNSNGTSMLLDFELAMVEHQAEEDITALGPISLGRIYADDGLNIWLSCQGREYLLGYIVARAHPHPNN
jgi:hypothetical protein